MDEWSCYWIIVNMYAFTLCFTTMYKYCHWRALPSRNLLSTSLSLCTKAYGCKTVTVSREHYRLALKETLSLFILPIFSQIYAFFGCILSGSWFIIRLLFGVFGGLLFTSNAPPSCSSSRPLVHLPAGAGSSQSPSLSLMYWNKAGCLMMWNN